MTIFCHSVAHLPLPPPSQPPPPPRGLRTSPRLHANSFGRLLSLIGRGDSAGGRRWHRLFLVPGDFLTAAANFPATGGYFAGAPIDACPQRSHSPLIYSLLLQPHRVQLCIHQRLHRHHAASPDHPGEFRTSPAPPQIDMLPPSCRKSCAASVIRKFRTAILLTVIITQK
jgi:hypothetical protein